MAPSTREYWFDPRHTGALRVIDARAGVLYGSDPAEPRWTAHVRRVDGGRALDVDFAPKRTHHGAREMRAVYEDRRNALAWPDGNRWLRIRVPPQRLLAQLPP